MEKWDGGASGVVSDYAETSFGVTWTETYVVFPSCLQGNLDHSVVIIWQILSHSGSQLRCYFTRQDPFKATGRH